MKFMKIAKILDFKMSQLPRQEEGFRDFLNRYAKVKLEMIIDSFQVFSVETESVVCTLGRPK